MISPNQQPVIELEHVSRSFGNHRILRDISAKIYPGETVALIGESGCGKSVTMKLMMSLLAPDVGKVYWNGSDLAKRSERGSLPRTVAISATCFREQRCLTA